MDVNLESDAIESLEIDICEERRESPRYPIDLFVMLPGDKLLNRKAGDISLGGVFVEVMDPVAKSETFSVMFQLPGQSNWIEAEVEVLGFENGEQRGVRCRFTSLDFLAQRLLARWLDTMFVLRQVA